MHFSKLRIILGLMLLASITAIILFFVKGKANDVEKNGPGYKEVTVERGTFQIIVSANGVVKPIDRIEIKSKASGQIEGLPVEKKSPILLSSLPWSHWWLGELALPM